jgi:hypothetical protein
MPQDAPSAAELEANPVARAAFVAAWADSFADNPTMRHEEGGWLYVHEVTGAMVVRRAAPGDESEIVLTKPPILPDHYLVAMFHTHPNPTDDGWNPEPSASDRRFAFARGVPNLVVSDMGIYRTGPERRVGGLGGPRGHPT